MMVFGEVSGECTIRKSNSMGATTLSFLGENSSLASFEHDATSKKMNIFYNNMQMTLAC